MKFTVSVEDAGLKALIAGMEGRAQNKRPALEAVADDFLDIERRSFSTLGGSHGHVWPPLSPAWARRKARHGRPARPLVYSGALEGSLTRRGSRYSRRRFTENSVIVGTGDPVAHLHQTGTKERFVKTRRGKPLSKPRSAGRLPARAPMFMTPADQARWRGIVRDHILGAAGGLTPGL